MVAVALLVVIVLTSERDGNVSGSSSPCTVKVTADSLNVRSEPNGNSPVVETINRGSVITADRTVRDGYRQLGPNRWAALEFLETTPGSNCG
jgi:hypothetical protein